MNHCLFGVKQESHIKTTITQTKTRVYSLPWLSLHDIYSNLDHYSKEWSKTYIYIYIQCIPIYF